ncbi:MAG: bifunctional nuclease family protein [Coriobacteriia bacterium]|nr:bifunctional nuclease family protein [Coriobacteriia bacterium]
MVPVRIHSLGLDENNNQPVVILREEDGHRVVPIWIGQPEATAILLAVQGITPPRPLTHDLMLGIVTSTGYLVERVEITRVEEGTFYAALILRGEERTIAVDARPSDSLALAVRSGCPVFVAEEVMRSAGVVPEEEAEQEVEAFRDFLDQVDPEDFGNS